MSTRFRLRVPGHIQREMIAHAVAEAPNECCGLLAGPVPEGEDRERGALVLYRYPLVNAAGSPVEYLSEPRSMFEAMRSMRERGVDVLAVYHSHPTSPPVPSRTDLERNYSEHVVNLIISLQGEKPEIRGWWLLADSYEPAAWETVGE